VQINENIYAFRRCCQQQIQTLAREFA